MLAPMRVLLRLLLPLPLLLPGAYGMSLPPPAGATTQAVDLGAGRSMTLFVPKQDTAAENEAIARILGIDKGAVEAQRNAMESFDNAVGQKLWPASVAFARMLTGAASAQVKGRDVVELGCGLGCVGIAAALAGAKSVVLTDFQPKSLEYALASADANGVGDCVSTRLLDWTAPPDDVGAFPFDVVLGSDVLYDKDLTRSLVGVVASLVARPRIPGRPEPRAMLVDPPFRPSRAMLPELCAASGLYWGGEVPVLEATEQDTVLIDILCA